MGFEGVGEAGKGLDVGEERGGDLVEDGEEAVFVGRHGGGIGVASVASW